MHSTERRSDERGFTLIELLIVMSIIIIITTFAIPNITKIMRQSHEMSAINSIQTIVKAQLQYQSTYPSAGYACAISALGGGEKGAAPGPQAAGLIPGDLSTGHKAGYAFTITNCTKTTINNQDRIDSYEITAVPEQVGRTGDRGFCSDDNQDIKTDAKGGTNCVDSINH